MKKEQISNFRGLKRITTFLGQHIKGIYTFMAASLLVITIIRGRILKSQLKDEEDGEPWHFQTNLIDSMVISDGKGIVLSQNKKDTKVKVYTVRGFDDISTREIGYNDLKEKKRGDLLKKIEELDGDKTSGPEIR